MPVDQDAAGLDLLLAARSGDIEVVRSLVRQGADLEKRDVLRDTGLLKAARYGHGQVVHALLVAGADVNARDNNGWTGLHTSLANDREEVFFVLLSGGHDSTPIDIEATTLSGDTPLHMAAFHGREWGIDTLLRLGANRATTNDGGQRPVDVARKDTVLSMLQASTASLDEEIEFVAALVDCGERGNVPRTFPPKEDTIRIGGVRGKVDSCGWVDEETGQSSSGTPRNGTKTRRRFRGLSHERVNTWLSVKKGSVDGTGDDEHVEQLRNGNVISCLVSKEIKEGTAFVAEEESDRSFEEGSSEGELSLDIWPSL